MDDTQIVDLYWARSETAIAETEKKYGRYCHYIAYRILNSDEDAREVVNDTYLKAWETIPPQRPSPLKPYLGTISRRLALNRYTAQNAQKRGGQVALALEELAECIPNEDSGTELGESLALRQALNEFLRRLPRKTRKVFVRRYWYADTIAEIAEQYSMKESAVAMLLFRTRHKLKDYLEKEDFPL